MLPQSPVAVSHLQKRLGIPGFGKHPNDMICHFLLHLENDGYAEYIPRDRWEITTKGVKVINEHTQNTR